MKQIVVNGMSRNEIEYYANQFLKGIHPDAYYGNEPADVETIFDVYLPLRCGIQTGYTDLSKIGKDVLGFTDAKNKRCFIDKSLIDSDDPVTMKRCRATIGHEIGHCLYHVPILRDYLSFSVRGVQDGFCRREKSEIKPYEDPEWQAWEFAGALLMPKSLVIESIRAGLTRKEIAEKFDVNPAFLDVRLKHQLKINPF